MHTEDKDAKGPVANRREVYEKGYEAVESFEAHDQVGPDLAYLLEAMLKGTTCTWPGDRPFLNPLSQSFASEHPVWGHVAIDTEEA